VILYPNANRASSTSDDSLLAQVYFLGKQRLHQR
jgi:hypothetical protein